MYPLPTWGAITSPNFHLCFLLMGFFFFFGSVYLVLEIYFVEV